MSEINSAEIKLLMDAVTKIHEQTTLLQKNAEENSKSTSDNFARMRESIHKIANDNHASQALLGFLRQSLEELKTRLEKESESLNSKVEAQNLKLHSRIDIHSEQSQRTVKELRAEIKDVQTELTGIKVSFSASDIKTNSMWTLREKVLVVVAGFILTCVISLLTLSK